MWGIIVGFLSPAVVIASMWLFHRRLEMLARRRQEELQERLEQMRQERDALHETILEQNATVTRRSRETTRAIRKMIDMLNSRGD